MSSNSDARLLELRFLSELDRTGWKEITGSFQATPQRDMIAHLLQEGLVNDISGITWGYQPSHPMEVGNIMRDKLERNRWDVMNKLLGGQNVHLRIGHKGRVRLSELRQALLSGRSVEPFGILLDGRHLRQDLTIALLSAREDAPVSIAFLDMNGLKQLNDTYDHDVGDHAIQAYLNIVKSVTTDKGDAYRCGGDEVVVVLPATNGDAASKTLTALLLALEKEHMEVGSKIVKLSASCGVVTITDPATDAEIARTMADQQMYRAKNLSKKGRTRCSVLAMPGAEPKAIGVPKIERKSSARRNR